MDCQESSSFDVGGPICRAERFPGTIMVCTDSPVACIVSYPGVSNHFDRATVPIRARTGSDWVGAERSTGQLGVYSGEYWLS